MESISKAKATKEKQHFLNWQINDLARKISLGEKPDKDSELEFYINNHEEIEKELHRIKKALEE